MDGRLTNPATGTVAALTIFNSIPHIQFVNVSADLLEYPRTVNTKLTGFIILGDLHGCAVKLIYFLIQEGVIQVSEDDYNNFRRLYQNFNSKSQENINLFLDFIKNIIVVNRLHLVLIGDIFAERSVNDFPTFKILDFLDDQIIPYTIINSNHDNRFQLLHETPDKNQTIYNNKQDAISMVNLFELYKKRCTDNQKIIDHNYIDAIYKKAYKPHVVAVFYNLSFDQKHILICSHAPIDIRIISAMYDTLKTISGDDILNVDFNKTNPLELAKSIDRLNIAYRNYTDKAGLSSLCPFSTLMKYANCERNLPLSAITDAPFYVALWSRTYSFLDRNNHPFEDPTCTASYGYGHDSKDKNLQAHIYPLDNTLSKHNMAPGHCTSLRVNGKSFVSEFLYSEEAKKQVTEVQALKIEYHNNFHSLRSLLNKPKLQCLRQILTFSPAQTAEDYERNKLLITTYKEDFARIAKLANTKAEIIIARYDSIKEKLSQLANFNKEVRESIAECLASIDKALIDGTPAHERRAAAVEITESLELFITTQENAPQSPTP